MTRITIFLALTLIFTLPAIAQTDLKPGRWRAALQRKDGRSIPFTLEVVRQSGKTSIYIVNGAERVKTEDPVFTQDSVVIRMPVFESYFKARITQRESLRGVWVSGSETGETTMPFTASAGGSRFPAGNAAARPVQGKWKIEFTRANQTKRHAIGEFTQQGNMLSGSVLTPSADYRYLDGVVNGDSLFLSTFDGSHALLLSARINPDHMTGKFYNGNNTPETWLAVKDANVALTPNVTTVRKGNDGKLAFSFQDLDGNTVSLPGNRFKGKVVIVQIMGSWCPNCMDEMAFLSDYYKRNRDRGVEIIALAYELSTDRARSEKSLRKFQTKFDVQYPLLITGATASDPQRTQKTLPQLTDLKTFPTTIILDKHGVVRDIHTSFYGPGAGEYHTKFKTTFEAGINALLNETL
ncbi:peroxiredoxin family protein [Dawidia soli]|uniref:TlpA family protein disulfide reductase n=1 Tax=Dawidia soli TaxID=2782352 RepID=A0AAP2DH19_9BACT|nr:TlpA disulfide reductase family protein [Dawidia soli]MBT1690690.1 TlpA family protein disulfide reductase [Dawidia soli]